MGPKNVLFFSFFLLTTPLWGQSPNVARNSVRQQLREDLKRQLRDKLTRDRIRENHIEKINQEAKREGIPNTKIAIDSRGRRVRIEERLIWPADNQFKHILLNFREGSLHYYYETTTTKYGLSKNLEMAKNILKEKKWWTSAPNNWITSSEMAFSNSIDIIQLKGTYTDPVAAIQDFKSCVDSNCIEPGTLVWAHQTKEYTLRLVGPGYDVIKEKEIYNWTIAPSGPYSNVWYSNSYEKQAVNQAGNLAASDVPLYTTRIKSAPFKDSTLEITRVDYKDGSWIEADSMILKNGRVANKSEIPSIGSSRDAWNQGFYAEIVFRAKEFQGRDIDLVYQGTMPGGGVGVIPVASVALTQIAK